MVGDVAAHRRRQLAVTVGKERREALVRTKRLCRDGIVGNNDFLLDREMVVDVEQSTLDSQTCHAVEELKSALLYTGKGSMQKKVDALRDLRHLLSKSEVPPVGAALKAGAIPVLVQCLSFGSPDEQLLEAAWCLTNIAAGEHEQTKALLPALPLLVAHLGVEKSSMLVAEQCAWALGNVAGEGEELRNILLAQGALPSLARMMLSSKGSTARTASWALSNLIKGPDPKAATQLIKIDGVLDEITQHMRKEDADFLISMLYDDVLEKLLCYRGEELATEVAWVIVYLSALSDTAISMLVKSGHVPLLVERLATSNSLQLLIPVIRSLGNLIAADSNLSNALFIPGHDITDKVISAVIKCLQSEHRALKKEAAWVLSNIAAGSFAHKQLIYSSEAIPLLLRLLLRAPFDIKKEVAYVLGNLCVAKTDGTGLPNVIVEHLVSLVGGGCLEGFVNLVRSPDNEAARLGLQFLELVMRGLPNGEGPKLVEREDGIDALERFQFHENEELRSMANGLLDKYFGEEYGLE
ncbi:Importin subunit alpha-9 [Asimina triloba]